MARAAQGHVRTWSDKTGQDNENSDTIVTIMASPGFPVLPIDRFAGRNAAVRRPTVSTLLLPFFLSFFLFERPQLTAQEITRFSYDEAHKLRHDASSLRSYYPPELHASLSRGFESFVEHDDGVDEHLDGLLVALVELERRTATRVKADIVTWRGMVTKVCLFWFYCFVLLCFGGT